MVKSSINVFIAIVLIYINSNLLFAQRRVDLAANQEDVRIIGETNQDSSGYSLAFGDIDGDSFSDLIIGAPGFSDEKGKVYIIYGDSNFDPTSSPQNINLPTSATHEVRTIIGADFPDRFGHSVATGDIDGDGYADVIVGAPGAARSDDDLVQGAGKVYVIYSKMGTLRTNAGLATIDLGGIIPTDRITEINGGVSGDSLGFSVASGNINGDERTIGSEMFDFDDVIAGAPFADKALLDPEPGFREDAGATYVIYGNVSLPTLPTSFFLDAIGGAQITEIIGENREDHSGWSVASGDINEDHAEEVVIGAPNALSAIGRTYVISGFRSAKLTPSSNVAFDLVSPPDYPPSSSSAIPNLLIVQGESSSGIKGDKSGSSVATGNIDERVGKDDLIIGAPFADLNFIGADDRGHTYVLFDDVLVLGSSPPLVLSVDIHAHIIIQGIDPEDHLGWSVASGDFDNDDLDDVITGAPHADVGERIDVGEAYTVFASNVLTNPRMFASNANIRILGENPNAFTGFSVSAGDINNTGGEDFTTGAPGYSTNPNFIGHGESYIVYGCNLDAEAGAHQLICGLSTILTAVSPSVGMGTWSGSGPGTLTFVDVNQHNTNVTANAFGTYTLIWSVSDPDSTCPQASDKVLITFIEKPTKAIAGENQKVCGLTATLSGNTATVGSGMWTSSDAGATFVDASAPNTDVTVSALGAHTFTWTISNDPCPPSSDDVLITFVDNPTIAAAGPDDRVCGLTATLSGNTATVGSGMWTSSDAGATFVDASAPNTDVTVSALGAHTFTWTISNDPCPPSSDDVLITFVDDPTIAAAGPDDRVCGLTATLSGNTATVGSGMWTSSDAGATFVDASAPNTDVTVSALGAHTFTWTISNDPCPPSSDDVLITFVDNPTIAAAGPDDRVCGLTATLSGNTATVGSGMWTSSDAGATFVDASAPNTDVTVSALGAHTFTWTISNDPCPPSSDDVLITFVDDPTIAAAGPDDRVCGLTATLSGNTATVGSGMWTSSDAGATFVDASAPNTDVTVSALGAHTFTWTISNDPCPPSSDDVLITFVDNPTIAAAGPDDRVCGLTATLSGNTATVGSGMWTSSDAGATFVDASAPNTDVTVSALGAHTFTWTISNYICPPSEDHVQITFTENPTPASAGPDQVACGTSTILAGNNPIIGSGIWTIINGAGGSFNDATRSDATFSGNSNVTYTLRWTISNEPCPSSSDEVLIEFDNTEPSCPTINYNNIITINIHDPSGIASIEPYGPSPQNMEPLIYDPPTWSPGITALTITAQPTNSSGPPEFTLKVTDMCGNFNICEVP